MASECEDTEDTGASPHAFSSVKISVKKPGSELIRNMLALSRLTIKRQLCKDEMIIIDGQS